MFSANLKIKDVKASAGLWVRNLRKVNGMSQQELADKLSLSRVTIQKMESGSNFTIDTFLLALQHFDQLQNLEGFFKNQIEKQTEVNSLY
jgi:transcriptional regulator with XRE-family HTH domain